MNQNRKSNIPSLLPGLLISLAAIIVIFKFVDLNLLLISFKSIRVFNILIFFLLLMLALAARTAAWKNLIDDINFRDAFLIINEGYFFNNLIPRSGEITRVIITSTISKKNAIEVASIILFERALDVIIASGMFLITLPMVVSLSWIKPIAVTLMLSLIILVVIMLFTAVKSEWVNDRLNTITSKNEFINRFVINGIKSIIKALSTLNRPVKIIVSILWILVTWIIWTFMLFYGIRIISPDAPFWWSIFAEGVLALGIALPSAPASLGIYEGTMVVALAVFGIQTDQALSLAIVLHIIQIIITSILGIYGLFVHGFSIKELIVKIRNRLNMKEKEKMA